MSVDERAEQPLAVLVGGAVLAAHSAGRSCASASICSRDGSGGGYVVLGELRLGVSEFAELGLPAGLEGAGDEAVLGLAGVECALGADRFIAGPLDA